MWGDKRRIMRALRRDRLAAQPSGSRAAQVIAIGMIIVLIIVCVNGAR